MDIDETLPSWEKLIIDRISTAKLKSRTCKIYNRQAWTSSSDRDTLCPCERLIRRHSFDDTCLQPVVKDGVNPVWNPPNEFRDLTHSTKVPIDVFGTLKSPDCKFLRVDTRSKMEDIYNLLLDDCGGDKHKPALILSVYGGAKYFTMTERLEKEIIRGIVDAASAADTWILTAGINNGVSKLVGEGISHYRLLREYPNRVKCIGMTMWGTVNESTRYKLKQATNNYPKDLIQRQISDNVQEDKETVEQNHTHCILFDGGLLSGYLADRHRHELVTHVCKRADHTCYAVTIIVEGGINTLEVLENDIMEQRPFVLIQGSGRLADVLATLIEQNSSFEKNDQWIPTDEEVLQVIEQFLPNPDTLDIPLIIRRIKNILKKDNRYLIHVFSLNHDDNVAETIFKAIFVKIKKNEIDNEAHTQEQRRRNDEDKLVNLALEWNYFDGVLPILQSRQDAKVKRNRGLIEEDIKREKEIFKRSLEKNRPVFVEYFLAASFDPLILIETGDASQRETIISNLYKVCHTEMNKNHAKYITAIFGTPSSRTIEKLDHKLKKFVGSFIGPIYTCQEDSIRKRVYIDMKNYMGTCCKSKKGDDVQFSNDDNQYTSKYTKDHLLRDLFLWSVFMDMPEMAKKILVHVPSRICAALIASAIFKRYAKRSTTVYLQEKFQNQALEFETYAAMFIDKCYEYNERLACELLLRQIPLFGDITCMQVAISSESAKLLGTACFDQTLNQVWYNKLSITNYQTSAKPLQALSILSFGLLASFVIHYRDIEPEVKDRSLSSEGINYYMDKEIARNGPFTTYWSRFKYFHESPMIKMCYHFISYIFFLLVFSYMMLYELDQRDTFTIPHWTEIYVIITVSTMFCEEIRKLYHEYKTRMIERWGSTGSVLLTVLTNVFYITPYFLFYLGLGFRYGGYTDELITTARIIWAYDLELWYLGSLKFIIALKSIGPKLFMLKNMLQDLFAFVYMIFIAISAYGVVSRSLILYKQIPFTINDIFKQILYEPYWFIYGAVSDKDLLDEDISNGTSSLVAEATATHVLLAFHMLFINILILNLLIAVFTRTIVKVQENTEFYWRYQRYSFVRQYFERPPLAYPPLIIFTHIFFLFLAIRRKCWPKSCRNQVANDNHKPKSNSVTSIFKMIPVEEFQHNERWDVFENAATHSYARSILEKDKKKDVLTIDDNYSKRTITTADSDGTQSITDEQQTIKNLKEEIITLKSVLTDTQKNIGENNARMEKHAHDMNKSLDWIMKAIARVKMNDPSNPPLNLEWSLPQHNIPFENPTTTTSTQ